MPESTGSMWIIQLILSGVSGLIISQVAWSMRKARSEITGVSNSAIRAEQWQKDHQEKDDERHDHVMHEIGRLRDGRNGGYANGGARSTQ